MLQTHATQIRNLEMKLIATLILLFASNSIAYAQTFYVAEKFKLNLRSGASNRHKILKLLPSGTALTLLKKNAGQGFSQIRTASGLQGYVATRMLQKEPTAQLLLKQITEELQKLKIENRKLKNNKNALDNKSLIIERDQLQERLVAIGHKHQQLKREKQAIANTFSQDWLFNGGIVALAGVLFGLIISRFNWRRSNNSWESY